MMKQWLLLAGIIAIALTVRLYRINTPLADWHSWRQADTAAVTRRFNIDGVDLLHPRYDDLSSIPSGRENPQGYRMVEFPLINGLTAWLYQALPVKSLEIHVFSRLASIIFSLGSLIFLYLLVAKLSGRFTAHIAALVFALLPYNIFYSRVVLPEVPLVFFILGGLYLFTASILTTGKTTGTGKFWLSAIFWALALLLKPSALFFTLPLIYLALARKGWRFLFDPLVYLFLVIIVAPFLWWRQWIQQFPEGIPAYTWLLNGNGIRFKGAWFRWLFADRFGRLILGYFGLIPMALGIVLKPQSKEGWFYHFWLLGVFAYLAVFATGNVQHDYYQVITIPIICIFIAKGIVFLLHPNAQFSRLTSYFLLLTSLLFMLAFGWFYIRDFFNINHPEIVAAGKAADQILPKDAKVIAPYMGDTAFLYQINRQGWPIGGNIEEKIKLGATHYVTTTLDAEAQELGKKYLTVAREDQYIIFSLK